MFIPWWGLIIIVVAFLWALSLAGDTDRELRGRIDDLEDRIDDLEKIEERENPED